MPTHFIVHDKADTVGVMVVENSQAGQELPFRSATRSL